jgi:ABC-type polysaccharide/polyol phosphate transport system ATPase subunit
LRITQLNKTFRLPHEQAHTLKERALHPFRHRKVDTLHAVRDFELAIPRGEFHGIVGRNGSGKSTLLKCIAGIYRVDSGQVEIAGRLSPFIELGVGFNPDLTARDNVIINAIMLGLSRREALARFDDIVDFAELHDFMDLKLKNYSSGMHVRLAFAVAIQVEADILLIDEVLAVGDAAFQRKCYDEFSRLKASGRTIVFVTHDMGAVERFCDRATLLERGRHVLTGPSAEVARRYNELNFLTVRQEARQTGGPAVLRRRETAAILEAGFEAADGEPAVYAKQGDPLIVRARIHFYAAVEDPLVAVALLDDGGRVAFATSSWLVDQPTGAFSSGDEIAVEVRFDNWLAPGRYRLVASITPDGDAANAYDLREDIASIIVWSAQSGGGVVDLPHRFAVERLSPDRTA